MIAGTLTLLVATGAAAQEQAGRWTLEEDLRIGSVDDPEYALTDVGDVRVGPDGAMYVWQQMAHGLVVFDAAGRRRGLIGGRGAGPGEFLGRAEWTWKTDTLAGFDLDQQRYSLFLPGGTHVRTGRILPEGSIGSVVLTSVLADGSALGWPRGPREEGIGSPRFRFSAEGVLLDTLFVLRPLGGAGIVRLPRGLVITFRRPLEQGDLFARDPLGRHVTIVERAAASAPGDHSFRAYRIALDGDTLFDRPYRYTARPVDPAWADSARRASRDRWTSAEFNLPRSGGALTASEIDLLQEALAIPEFHPPVRDVVVGRDGSAWLRRDGESSRAASWLVLDPAGRIAGRVAAPNGLEIRNADASHVWGVVKDALDVPYLVRYRIRR